MKMRNLAAGLTLAWGAAFAGAPYDGIYQVAEGHYLSVHERNGFVIASQYFTLPAENDAWNLNNGQRWLSDRSDVWDLLSGPIVNGVAQLSGQNLFGACVLRADLSFNPPQPYLKYISMGPTSRGIQQGVLCHQVLALIIASAGGRDTWAISKVY